MTDEQGAILVTGGAGYIGSHAVLALLDRDEKVVVFDDLSTGLREMVPAGALFEEGSVGDAARVKEVIGKHGIDTIMHFAAVVKVDESVRDPEKYMRINSDYTKTLVHAAGEAGVKRFIFSSTCAVYGNAEQNPISEETLIAPVSPYAESKDRAEKIIQEAAAAHRMQYVILRYFNVAGTDASGRSGYKIEEKPSHLIRGAVRALLGHQEFMIFGTDYPTPDGTCIRDFVHVSDIAEAHALALTYIREGGVSRIFNCGSERGYSNLEVVNALQRVAHRDLVTKMGDRREGDPAALVADATRIKRELHWKPMRALDDMIRDELAWVQTKV